MTKQELKTHCESLISQKIADLDNQLESIQSSANDETKSSMGDKYETSRAMMMQEMEKLSGQKALMVQQLRFLQTLSLSPANTVAIGSLVKTDLGTYFISVALGPVEFNEKKVFCVSGNSPIAKAIMGTKTNEKVEWNGQSFFIQSID
jgi:transcription elongation GreA/GreB family factor